MAVTNATPKVQFTGNNSTTEFAFNFVVPASLDTGLINDSTAGITQGTTSLTVSTADLFYTSDLQGKTITIAGAGAGSSTLTTTIVTVNSGTNVTIADAASVTVNNAAIVVTTGQTGTTLKNNNEIEVFVDSTQQTITTDYTVRLNVGDDLNKQGTVIFTSPPASSTTVTIARNIELSRTSDFQSGGALTARELNAQFDNVVMAVQDQKNDDDRFVQFPANEPASTSGVLPDSSTRAGKFFTFDNNGAINVTNTLNFPAVDLTLDTLTAANISVTTGTITNLTSNSVDISGGLIDSTTIGTNTPSTGAFTTLSASGTSTLTTVDIDGGAIDGTTIGATSPNTGAFTTLTASGQATFPAVNINGGTIDGATIGADSPANGTFADLTVNGTLTNTGGQFVLGSIFATGTDGLRTKKVRSETTNELSIESQSNQDISITTDGIGKLNLKSSDIQINPTGTTSTTVGGRTYTGNIITSDNDLIFNNYNSPGSGAIKFLSNDGIHIDGTNPKVKGQLQLQLEDGSAVNNILLSNSADSDTPGIQINTHQNSHTKIGQVQYPPQMQQATGSISVGAYPRLQYKKTLVFGLSGSSFSYPAAAVGDKFVRSGSVDDFGFITKAVTAGTTNSSIQYEVLTNKQTWDQGTYLVVDSASQTTGFTSGAGTPQISTQNNDTDFYIGWDNSSNANNLGITSDSVTEGSSNLYFTDARADTRIGAASIGDLFNVSTSSLQNGDVIAYNSSNGLFENGPQTSAPVTSVAGKTGTVILTSDDIAGGGTLEFYTEAQFNSSLSSKTTDNLAEGSGNLYYTNERVDDQVATLLTAGTGIQLDYNDAGGALTITNTQAATEIVNDTSPQLGNGLDVNGHEIFSQSNQDIKIQPHGTGAVAVGADNTNATITTNGTGDLTLSTNGGTNSGTIKIIDGVDGEIELTPNGSGNINLHGYRWPSGTSTAFANGFLKISSVVGGVAQLAWSSGSASGLNNIVEDTTPQLGGALDLNGQQILGQVSGTADTVLDSNSLNSDLVLKFNGTPIFKGDAHTTIKTQGTNGNIELEPNGTGQVRLDTDLTELHSTKGLIIHDGAQGTYLDLTGSGGANIGPLYGAGIHAEETNGGAQLSLFSHKSNGATAYPNLWAHRSRDDGSGNKDFLNNDDIIFSFFGAAYDGGHGGGQGTFRKTASVELKASENHSASDAINGNGGGKIEFHTVDNGTMSYSGTKRLTIDDNIEPNAHIIPTTDNTYDLGSSSKQFRNIYTGDLNLSNERHDKGNAVDGTTGNWTIQEGAEDLFLLNNNTGKKYKFALKEIE
jgi:hypothetical protein